VGLKERAQLLKRRGLPNFQHWTFSDLKRLIPDLDSWWSFAFVRSPWDRLYSEYRYRTIIRHDTGRPFAEWATETLERAAESPSLYDNHIRPQCDFLGRNTHIFRFEQIDLEMNKVCAELGVTSRPLKQYLNSGDPDEFRLAYTDSLVEQAGRYYRNDIMRIGYHFE
jgi:hypothetical protein